MPQIKIPAVYYRGGTSKGVFFKRSNLPEAAREAGSARDKILLRVLGSPDPYGKQIDGLGNASSSTSKAVILDKSERTDHDVDYLFGQVSIDKPFVDWSGNCGNLTAAVGAFAIEQGLVDKSKIPSDGLYSAHQFHRPNCWLGTYCLRRRLDSEIRFVLRLPGTLRRQAQNRLFPKLRRFASAHGQ